MSTDKVTLMDYRTSTADLFADDAANFVGKYGEYRKMLDYSYHRRFAEDRQLLHDSIIDKFTKTIVHDADHNVTCEAPLVNWIVFTAGPMGAGKSHILRWLNCQGYFPLDAFVRVDPDLVRSLLPESADYFLHNPNMAGILTQKEVGYISEVLTLYALQEGKNAIVDGSLRDAQWYTSYLKGLRDQFPRLRIAIMQVLASEQTILLRAKFRAEVTGRVVPEWLLLQYIEEVPHAVAQLTSSADYVCSLWNDRPDLMPVNNDNKGRSNEFPSPKSGSTSEETVKKSDPISETTCDVSEPDVLSPRRTCEQAIPSLIYTSNGSLSWTDFKAVWTMRCSLPRKLMFGRYKEPLPTCDISGEGEGLAMSEHNDNKEKTSQTQENELK